MPRKSFKRSHSGQALIETIIGGAVLITLMLLVVIVGKYQAVDIAAIQAARAIAFDCAALPDTCGGSQAPASVRSRWRARLTGSSGPDYFHQSLWTTRSGQPLLESADHIKLAVRQEHFGAVPGVAKRGPAGERHSALQLVSRVAGPGRFGLDIQHGLLSASANIELLGSRESGRASQILSGMAITPSAKVSILTDGWNASGPDRGAESVHARVDRGWRVNKTLDKVIRAGYAGTKLFIRGMALLFLEDQADEFKHQEIPMDEIPSDRLPGAGGETR